MKKTRLTETKAFEVWNNVLDAALKLPGARIDREAFLRVELSKRVPEEIVRAAIDSSPAIAGVSKSASKEIATAAINHHLLVVSGLSFLAGIPGGWWLLGAVPADLAQFFLNAIQVAQKLAYTYGWPQFISDNEIDDDTRLQITLFLAVMMGAAGANRILAQLSEQLAQQAARRIPQKALTKFGLYNLVKKLAAWIGIRLTKGTAGRIIAKIIPVVGGAISAGVSYVTFKKMSWRLQRRLARLPLAKRGHH